MSEQVNTPEVVSEDVVVMSGPPVGEQLRLAREARGLEVADIAQTLKLGPRQAEALEAAGGEVEEAPPETEGSISVKRRFNRREAIVKQW